MKYRICCSCCMLFALILLGSLLIIPIAGMAVTGPDFANQSSPIKNAAVSASDSATEITLIKLLLTFGLIVILIEASLAYIAHWEAELDPSYDRLNTCCYNSSYSNTSWVFGHSNSSDFWIAWNDSRILTRI